MFEERFYLESTIGNEEYFEDMIHLEKFYIHPNSLHLLEPQVGDVIYFKTKKGDLILHETITGLEPNSKLLIEQGAKIIQRNGIAFMWPEVEQ